MSTDPNPIDTSTKSTDEEWNRPELQSFHIDSSVTIPSIPTSSSPPSGNTATSEMATSSSNPTAEDEKPAPPAPAVGLLQLFRFADSLDYVLMAIGSVGALVHGCSLPVFLRFFADLVNSFGSNADDPDTMVREVVKVVQISYDNSLFSPCEFHPR
jgi:ATP-binding cassette, subfamily B (MDR/TAP), member 1